MLLCIVLYGLLQAAIGLLLIVLALSSRRGASMYQGHEGDKGHNAYGGVPAEQCGEGGDVHSCCLSLDGWGGTDFNWHVVVAYCDLLHKIVEKLRRNLVFPLRMLKFSTPK